MKNNYPVALCFLVFCVGALTQFDVTLIARVPLAEVLAFGSTPFLLRGVGFGRISHRLAPVVWVLLIWSVGIVLSDLVNGFIFERFIRAFMKPLFCGCWMLFFIGVLMRDFRAIMLFPIGKILAAIQNYLAPRSFSEGYMAAGGYEAISYGVLPIVSAIILALAVLLYRKSRLWAVVAFLGSATILLVIGAPRSAAAMAMLNAAIIFYIWWTRSAGRRSFHLSKSRLFVMGILGSVTLLSIYYAYIFAAGAGWLGELQYAKLQSQQNTIFGTNPIGLILGGRTYVFAAILGIIDQPLLGHGSWTGFLMSDYYFEAVSLVGTDAREIQRLSETGWGGLAGHSLLFQGWLENGILTAISLCIIAYWTASQFLQLIAHDNRITPFVVFTTTGFFWAFLFSPFGVETRIAIGLFLAFHVLHFHRHEGALQQRGSS